MKVSDGSYELLAHFAPAATSYLGIGVQEGVCVQHVVRANPTIHLTLCDTWGREHGGTGRGSHHHIDQWLQQHGHDGRREYLNGPSQEMIPRLDPRPQFDLIYVDGSHEEAAALDDLRNCWPRLVVGGVMLVHDIKMPPVWSAVLRWLDEVQDANPSVKIAVGGHGTAVIRRRS